MCTCFLKMLIKIFKQSFIYNFYISLYCTNTNLFFSGRISCPRCGRRFKHEFSLVCHLRSECGSTYRCQNCNFQSDKLNIWLRHVQGSQSCLLKGQEYFNY